jgi:RNA polymerase sigma factor (sigma-70 family)
MEPSFDPGNRFARCAALITASRITTGWHAVNYPYFRPRTYPTANDENGTPLSSEREQAFVERMKQPVLPPERSEIRTRPDEERDDALPPTPPPEARVAAAPVQSTLRPTWVNIEEAHRMHLDGTDGGLNHLMGLVGKLSKVIAYDTLGDSPRVTETVDDVAQNATIAVLMSLPKFKGQSGQFYKWAKRVIKNECTDGFNKGIKESKVRVPFLLENEDGTVTENPDIYENEFWVEMQRELPEFIQGDNLKICQYIREGFDYEKIALVLSMTEAAVKQRVAGMRKTIEEMRATGKKV